MLLAALGRPPGSQGAPFRAYVADPHARIYVAELEREVVGVASLCIRARLNWATPEGWIPDLFVRPEARRRGVAIALLDVCAETARSLSSHLLRLDCGHDRTEAHALYERYGFRHAGRDYRLTL